MALIRRVSSSFPRVFGFANRSLYSLNSPGESLGLPTSSSFAHGIHVFHCPVSSPPAVIFSTCSLIGLLTKLLRLYVLCILNWFCYRMPWESLQSYRNVQLPEGEIYSAPIFLSLKTRTSSIPEGNFWLLLLMLVSE